MGFVQTHPTTVKAVTEKTICSRNKAIGGGGGGGKDISVS